jgi:hypothetical protein
MEKICRVSLFKRLVDDYGHPFYAGLIERHAPSREKEIEAASKMFAKATNVLDQSLHGYKVAEVCGAVSPRPGARTSKCGYQGVRSFPTVVVDERSAFNGLDHNLSWTDAEKPTGRLSVTA